MIVAALNAVIPPVLAALRLPLTLVLGFLLVLIADALILQLAAEFRVTDGLITVDAFGWALLAAPILRHAAQDNQEIGGLLNLLRLADLPE